LGGTDLEADMSIGLWTPDGTPFCWQPKEAFERIEQGLERGASASAKLVYLALTRIASNERSRSFSKPIAYIATLASLGRRTVERRLPDLERLGLVEIQRLAIAGTKARDLSRYTLPTLCRKVASQSRKVATARSAITVAVNKEDKKARKSANRLTGPHTTAARIALENKHKILKNRLADLEAETAEQWQRDEHPERLTQLKELRAEILDLEDQLLSA
jgi:hypothetical protein